jgi:multicomponent Na+:H+ antiporter subunit E
MLRTGLSWLAFLFILWLILADPRPGAWAVGLLAAGLGVVLRLRLHPDTEPGPRLLGFATFLPYFLWQSVRGGWDVSRRALTPGLPLDPDLLSFPLSLPPGPSRVFMTNSLSLLPGTFGAELKDQTLTVHLLVSGAEAEARVEELEERVARLFGLELS